MQIIEKRLTDEALKKNEFEEEYQILVDGEIKISVNDYGEPEDNKLCRDLNFAYNIVPLMKLAFEAGKNGELFEISEEKVNEL